ncbi:hypothetical protein PLESTB_001757900 [Pleodorina starrii]|uniref:TRAM domain-containing protein n=1 Tax=Pleodorina starrii TaxID=330485 RepID=A0A9W6F9J3_9CHLO|nr:hypothetical protein PLESTM_000599500 [Pleodorina starrii]GLC61452.1 hypothetical protein PLESTB_001757900 [Pleodorina starrii]GLC74092.1 hypothetical protein PLESTF_001459000 [Pleodorina starrii]
MNYLQSSFGSHLPGCPALLRRLTHAPQPPGHLPRPSSAFAGPRRETLGVTITQTRSSGLAPSQSWQPSQRLPPAHAVRDRPPAGRPPSRRSSGSEAGADADAAPPRRSSRPPPSSSRSPRSRPGQAPQRRRADGGGKAASRAPREGAAAPKSASAPSGPLQVGQEVELECARLALEGKGVCLLPPTGFVVLVERTLPGERVLARVQSVKKGYAEARKLASLSPHRNAVPPPCPYFGPCGGCTLQSLQYEAQLGEKRNQVEQTLRRVGRLGPSLDQIAAEAEAGVVAAGVAAEGGGARGVAPTEACREPFAYRNKLMFHFSSRCWLPPDTVEDRPCLGLLRPGTADVVLPVVQHGCKLQGDESNALLARVEQLVSEAGLLPYNHPSGKGSLKHLVIRSGSGPRPAAAAAAPPPPPAGSELMVVFGVTHGSALKQLRPVAEALGREFPKLASVVARQVAVPQPAARGDGGGGRGPRSAGQRQDARRQAPAAAAAAADGGGEEEDALSGDVDAAAGGAETLLYGAPYIHDVVCGLTFRISPGSFFQTNSRQAEVLYDIVRQAAALRPGAVDTVLDLYCGTGTVGLSLAAECRQVVGVEVQESAVEDARRNAARNGIANASFICADVDAIHRALTASTAAAAAAAAAPEAPEAPPAEPAAAAPAPLPQPDVVIVDPARGGLSVDAAGFLSRCGARRVVYVSCNAATQARDLDRLCNGPGAPFRLVGVTPVDMFPHTDHVETVAVMDRRTTAAAPTAAAATAAAAV